MRKQFLSYYAGTLVALGALVAIVCLAGSWYINRLQSDLARTVKQDAAGMLAAVDLQVQLRHLRVHVLVLVADRIDLRWDVVHSDLARVDAALMAVRRTAVTREDEELAEKIEQNYAQYKTNLHLDRLPAATGRMGELAAWSDNHHMAELIEICRQLADSQKERMEDNLERSETQTAWAGRVLIGLGLVGVLAGLMSGYVTARSLTSRVAKLLVRVQAVQAHLDQDVGAMTVHGAGDLADLDVELDRIVQRVSTVCQRLHDQERELLRSEQLVAVGQLAASVAHEIRNPLTGVKLLLQGAVRPEDPTPLTVDRVHLLLQEIARIERTVSGLMDLAAAPRLDRRPQSISPLVAEAVKVAQSRAEVKSVVIQLEEREATGIASLDHDRLLSLLTNLLFNAIDASPIGGEVLVSTSRAADGTIQVVVADAGPGIDDALEGKLFTPFTTMKATGTGLGLSISRRIANEHGGTLTESRRLEGGACFTLTIPGTEHSHGEAHGR